MAGPTAHDIPGPSQLDFSFELDPADVGVYYDSTTGYSTIFHRDLAPFAPAEFEGAPLLPAIQDRAVLQAGRRVAQILVLTLDPVVVATDVVPFPVPPAADPTDSTQTWAPDPFWYEEENLFPPRPEFLTGNDGSSGIRIGDFAALPFEWDSATRELKLYQSIEVTLMLEPIPQGSLRPPVNGPNVASRARRSNSNGSART